jgi:diaminopimelate decarboxylase
MSAIAYRQGALWMEQVALVRVAEAVGTPVYVYSSAIMRQRYRAFVDALAGLDVMLCYAMKANSNLAVIRTFADLGAGADVVSVGELEKALRAGVPPEKIVFAGVGKSAAEMTRALAAGIHQFNVESEPELRALSAIAAALQREARIAVRINPDVDAGTHDKIATGRKEDKFGISWTRARDVYALARILPGIRAEGIAVHIGSQLTTLAPFEAAFRRLADLAQALRADGHAIRSLDLGGGLGIDYREEKAPSIADYAALARRILGGLGLTLVLEPGRNLVGNAGLLLARVIYVKQEAGRRFVILDSAMNDLIRPSLYGAWHDVLPVAEPPAGSEMGPVDYVGPVCESGDVLAKARPAPPLAPDDVIAIRSAGAYGAVMASTYNTRPLVPEVLVDGDRFAVVRPRQSLEALIGQDRLPPWQSNAGAAATRDPE